MVQYSLSEVTEGMILGESLFSSGGTLLVAAGFHLKASHIDMLRKHGYARVMIEVEGTESVVPEGLISDHVKQELSLTVNRSSREIAALLERKGPVSGHVVEVIKKDKSLLNDIIQKGGAAKVVSKVIDDITSEPWTFINLAKMLEMSDSLFDYAVRVAVISLCIGHRYRFPPDEMRQLGLGALNMDLGLLAVPQNIIDKTEPLAGPEILAYQQHTVYGHLMLSDNPAIPPTSATIALSHHEHQDGSGYPRGLKGENRAPVKSMAVGHLIHRFAEIVAVADSYEMMAYGRAHLSPPLGNEEAIRRLITMAGTLLNADMVRTLVGIVPVYPTGARIRVTKSPVDHLIGCSGVVAKVDKENLAHPQILLYETKSGQRTKPISLDLAKHKGVGIELLT